MPAQQLDLFAGAGNHSDQTGPSAVRHAVANSAAPSIRRRQTRRKAGFEPSVPLAKDPGPLTRKRNFRNGRTRAVSVSRGTEGSNPSPSSGESVSRGTLSSGVKNPGFPRGFRGCVLGAVGREPQGPANIAPTRSSISVGLYSSTAFPAMRSRQVVGLKSQGGFPNEIGLALGLGMLVDLASSDCAQAKPSAAR